MKGKAMTDETSIEDAPERRIRVEIHDDLMDQIREVHLISDLMISANDISDDTVRGVGTMLCRIASNADELGEEAWRLGGAA
jgi:hypothetical protein